MRSHVPVAVSLISPLSESTAYNGAFPARASQISSSVTQPPRVLPSADSRYNRSDVDAYRTDTVMLESQSGLAIGSLGEAVSAAAASLRARKPRTPTLRNVGDIAVRSDLAGSGLALHSW